MWDDNDRPYMWEFKKGTLMTRPNRTGKMYMAPTDDPEIPEEKLPKFIVMDEYVDLLHEFVLLQFRFNEYAEKVHGESVTKFPEKPCP